MLAINKVIAKKDCCGCGACANSCPKNCVEMKYDREGFLFPTIDSQKCIGCGICVKCCPVKNCSEKGSLPIFSGVLQDADGDSLRLSSSGGAFATIARVILKRGGAVFGAAFDDALVVCHLMVLESKDLFKLQGSKYVSSDLKDSFKKIKGLLDNGRPVLFSGTPCQVAGLKSFLGKTTDLLWTIDLVCHGTPSQKLFQKYLLWLGEKRKSKVEHFIFRNKKKFGWKIMGEYRCGGKNYVINPSCDPFYSSFLRGETFRKSCYFCRFANLKRFGDFTVGDFWGFYNDSSSLKMDAKKGMSILLVNTPRGMDLLKEIETNAKIIPMDLDAVCSGNGNLYYPSEFKPIRDEIYANIDLPFEKLRAYLYCENPVMYYIRRFRRKIVPKKLRDELKKILKAVAK